MADTDPSVELLVPQDVPPDHRSGFVAVMGRPNVGKSTLLNAYLGQKLGIVSDKPQTTRTTLLGILTLPEAQIIFVDTPGIHQPLHKLGEYMVKSALSALEDADVALLLVDLSFPPGKEDRLVAESLGKARLARKILVMNKLDLVAADELAEREQAYTQLIPTDEHISISATRGDNRDELLRRIIAALPFGPRYFPPDQITDQQERFFAAELIREQVLLHTRQEIPYSVAVVIDEFRQRRENLAYIGATILVEKESQKGIIIGEKGSMLKKIGAGARAAIQDLLGHPVYLDLWVKVNQKWRNDEAELRRLGYRLPQPE